MPFCSGYNAVTSIHRRDALRLKPPCNGQERWCGNVAAEFQPTQTSPTGNSLMKSNPCMLLGSFCDILNDSGIFCFLFNCSVLRVMLLGVPDSYKTLPNEQRFSKTKEQMHCEILKNFTLRWLLHAYNSKTWGKIFNLWMPVISECVYQVTGWKCTSWTAGSLMSQSTEGQGSARPQPPPPNSRNYFS